MKVASLFSGAGGLDLGLEQAGHEIILQCESDKGAQQVLRKHFPGTLLVEDICGLASLPKETELLAAGFPCIDVSRAGLRKGLQGLSTGLVRHVVRLLEQALRDRRGVPWVLLENVEALLDRIQGQPPVIKALVERLEALGYHSWAHRIINSAAFGIPNRRRRVFLVASLHGDARDVLLSQGSEHCYGACQQLFGRACYLCHDPQPEHMDEYSFALDLGSAQSAASVDMVPTFTTHNNRMCLLLSSGRMGLLRIEDAERLQGLPEGYTEPAFPIIEPGIGHHRIPSMRDSDCEKRDAHRFALIGNAVTVPVAKWLGERLRTPYSHKYMVGATDRPLVVAEESAGDDSMVSQPAADAAEVAHAVARSIGWEPCPEARLFEFKYHAPNKQEDNDGSNAEECSAASEAELLDAAAAEEDEVMEGKEDDRKEQVADFHHRTTLRAANLKSSGQQAAKLYFDSWPRTAWFVRGVGRFGVTEMSEAPKILPLVTLGDFITKVRRPTRTS